MSQRVAGLGTVAGELLDSLLLAAADAPAGLAAIIAPPRTVAVMPAPRAAVAIRVLGMRLIPCPAMRSSVGLPPVMTSTHQ
jgi:hypothetical protein